MGDATIRIRPLVAEDEAAWRELWAAYLRFYETEVGAAVYATTFARLLSGDAWEYRALIAEIDGRPAGLAHYLFHRHCWTLENVCYLQDLFVAAPARGKGIGRALIEAVYGAADRAGAPAVYWLTQESNAPARALYDRVGRLTPFIKYARP